MNRKMNKSTIRKFWIMTTVAALIALAGIVYSPGKAVLALLENDHTKDVLSGAKHTDDVLSRFDSEFIQKSPAGRYYKAMLLKHSQDFNALLIPDNAAHIVESMWIIETFTPGMEAMLDGKGDTVRITEEQVNGLKTEVGWMISAGSPFLREDIEKELKRFPLEQFVGMTMTEALDYVNANVPPIPTPRPDPTQIAVTDTPAPPSANRCVVGYDPDCLAEPTLIPGSDGQWAYYIFNGVYFEYPCKWRVELWIGRTDILSLVPADDSPEGLAVDDIPVFAGVYPDMPNVAYDPLTYPQTAWLRPTPFWNRLVTLPDFTGSEFLWTNDWDTSFVYVEAIFYDPNTQIALGMLMAFKNDPPNDSVYNPDLVQEQFPNFRHIMESFQIGKP
jgi:hypothetical protein